MSRVAVLGLDGAPRGEAGEAASGETLAGLRGASAPLDPARGIRRSADRTFHDITLPLFGKRRAGGSASSQVLIGYLHIAVDRAELHRSLQPLAIRAGAVAALLVLAWTLLIRVVARRATAPLASLARIVEDVAGGRLGRKLRAGGSEEVNRVISMVNILVAQVNEQKLHVETDNKLLALQVEQRNRELTRRNEELDQAVQQLTQSRNRLHELAFYDNLTELPNRLLFMEELQLLLQLAILQQHLIALLFIDLDNFKRVN
ncbi:MAG: diguanylate cyclase domain-containing protein, partial [Gammaproteobacteria bacterium]